MFRDELLSSYRDGALDDLNQRFTLFETKGSHEMVTVGPVPFSSLCAHHLLPFHGVAHVGYIPGKWLVGLSKIPRVVEHFARLLQMQERMTTQIADYLDDNLHPQGLIVLVEARHLCMECRGVKTSGAITRTSALRGSAKSSSEVREEFYRLLSR